MTKLLVYLKDYKKESVLGPLFKLLEASFELIVPLVVASMIDVGIANRDKGYILKMCLIMAFLGLIGLTCSVTAQFFAAKAAVGFATKLRHGLFEHIQKLSFSQMDREGTSTLITRITSDINQVQSGVNLVLRLFLRSPFIVFGAMIMAFTVDGKAALIFVVVIPILSVIVFGIMLISIPLYKKVQGALDRVLGITRENLTGVRVIRAFGQEEAEVAKFDGENDALRHVQNFRANESLNLCGDQRRTDRTDLCGCRPGRSRYPDPGTGGCPGQLYVPDTGGACEAGKSDHYGDQGCCLRKQNTGGF